MRTRWHTITPMAQLLAVLMATVIAGSLVQATIPASNNAAASPGTVVATDSTPTS